MTQHKAHKLQIKLMGTIIDVTIFHQDPKPILTEVERLLYLYERRFSANRPDSELMVVNDGAGQREISVHPDLYELIKLGKAHSCALGSNLNIAIGPLIQLWRIGFQDAKKPIHEEISQVLALIDPNNIQLDDNRQSVYLLKKGMKIDLGALAKGYIADKLLAYLKTVGVSAALINLGGNVLTMGKAPHQEDGYWRIGIQNPEKTRGINSLVLPIRDQSVVTSGIYERTLTIDGETYHHIFSSETGYPVQSDLASLTIISKRSVDCEIWTTRLFGKSLPAIMGEVALEPNIEAIAIMQDGNIYKSF
ncbi:FAD:protein FMN transferase [Streptococcus moroccensis]|uniref:FAD:protein FMN transferase n=1 Tax=Streptococcus moroccensis TaxID=1451356 RepID=A0ABT9YPN2_9STRE|nr:FAD:protein FMN transferase [Streptococcus moroccensis]MDQ0221956.1 thiamine biosynthesis lipoprotein [Streptococcus moroccensis]